MKIDKQDLVPCTDYNPHFLNARLHWKTAQKQWTSVVEPLFIDIKNNGVLSVVRLFVEAKVKHPENWPNLVLIQLKMPFKVSAVAKSQ